MRKFIFLSLGVGVVWFLAVLLPSLFLESWAERGQFGDTFGSINSLFTGLAFAGVIYTILLQRKELSLQRKELRLQREEMAASRKVLARQAREQRNQLMATIAELKFRITEAEISAIRLRAVGLPPGQQEKDVNEIFELAKQMEKTLADLTDMIVKYDGKPEKKSTV